MLGNVVRAAAIFVGVPWQRDPKNGPRSPQNGLGSPKTGSEPPKTGSEPPKRARIPPKPVPNPPKPARVQIPPECVRNPSKWAQIPQNGLGSPKMVLDPPKRARNPPKRAQIPPKRVRNPPKLVQMPPKRVRIPPKEARIPQNGLGSPKNGHGSPKTVLDPPKTGPDPPKWVRNPSKRALIPQNRLGSPKTGSDPRKMGPDPPKMAPAASQWTPVRLAQGPHACAGRVELFHEHQWGTVCDQHWDLWDAAVVCRELGCGPARSAPGAGSFGMGTGPIWMDGVNCTGMEVALSSCGSKGWGKSDCGHGNDAGVVCAGKGRGDAPLRLVNGSDRCSGRLEVRRHSQWGTVCDRAWGTPEATVVCRELGCGALASPYGAAHFGQGSGPIWLDHVQCNGSEAALAQCLARPWGTNGCDHGHDAGVVCAGSSPQQPLRLANGSNPCVGRVEVLHDHKWGTVCDDAWDLLDAAVVCRQLGCGEAVAAPTSARFGPGADPIWLDDVHCAGTEAALSQCQLPAWGEHNCAHSEDAGVVCSGPNPLQLRVQEGPGPCGGRLEVLYNGTWLGVCGTGWSLLEAAVVCRQLGCGEAQAAPMGAPLHQEHGGALLEGLSCRGTEPLLIECLQTHAGPGLCPLGLVATVVCAEPEGGVDPCPVLAALLGTGALLCGTLLMLCLWARCGRRGGRIEEATPNPPHPPPVCHLLLPPHPSPPGTSNGIPMGSLRLEGGPSRCAGRVEVLHNGTWGTVCDDGWGFQEGQVVCRELGCGSVLSVAPGARYGQGKGPIWLDDVNCTGEEPALGGCRAKPWGEHNCNHVEDASVECSDSTVATLGTLQLVNGLDRCAGRVEVLHEHMWGTVCDDGWDLLDAAVVCRQLGCGTALAATHGAHFGRGHDPIWLDEVNCTGSEAALVDCRASAWGNTNCFH
ncbi:scavenger receptor cysteine-rich domain-containing group B protein-like, partial [Neopsephotus bourkii]|uniref:scavenger receptor cysteine-rich domain-containing group B protein-like n=1 Tax=Neopsephotus bourkii TaxID=309878 RepID=UPI002AA58F04